MKISIAKSLILVAASASLAACGGAADDAQPEASEAASDAPAEVTETAGLTCEPLGDVAVSIETAEGGEHTLVTQIQNEQDPDAEPSRLALEATGMSAGREGTRFADEGADYVVWMMDDGTATVNTGELSVNCKAES